jgi:hypothetical protein
MYRLSNQKLSGFSRITLRTSKRYQSSARTSKHADSSNSKASAGSHSEVTPFSATAHNEMPTVGEGRFNRKLLLQAVLFGTAALATGVSIAFADDERDSSDKSSKGLLHFLRSQGEKSQSVQSLDTDERQRELANSVHSWAKVALEQVRPISHDCKIYRFRLPVSDQMLNLPLTSAIVIRGTINGEQVIREYTPITARDQRGFFELLIKVQREKERKRERERERERER